jgi:Uma2 family endonuclease
MHMSTLDIPADIHTLEGFRAWVRTLEEPAPMVCFVRGAVFLEMSQNYRTHAPVATEINGVLSRLAIELQTGMYCTPPSWFTCVDAELSTEPDGFFVRYDTLQRGDLHLNPERDNEMVGRPDFVLEVVSRSSRRKDRKLLPAAYAKAGVAEYWLIEVGKEGEHLSFRTLLLEDGAYVDAPVDVDGWRDSPTWGRSFRLRRLVNPAGLPEFRLDHRGA